MRQQRGGGGLNHVAAAQTGSKQTAKMSARDEDTLAEEEGEMEEMDEAGSDDDEGVEMEEERAGGEGEDKVYVPGMEPLQPGEELEMDRSAYRMYHECQTGECTLLLKLGEQRGHGGFNRVLLVYSHRRSVLELRRPERRRR